MLEEVLEIQEERRDKIRIWQTFCKGPDNIFRVSWLKSFGTATHVCHCTVKATRDNIKTNGHRSVLIKLYLQNQGVN